MAVGVKSVRVMRTFGWSGYMLNETIALKQSVDLQCIWFIFDVQVDVNITNNYERRCKRTTTLESVCKVVKERIVQDL